MKVCKNRYKISLYLIFNKEFYPPPRCKVLILREINSVAVGLFGGVVPNDVPRNKSAKLADEHKDG